MLLEPAAPPKPRSIICLNAAGMARVEAAATTSAIPARKNCLRYGVKKGIKPLKAARLPFFSSRLVPVSGDGVVAVVLVLPVSVLVVIVFRFDLLFACGTVYNFIGCT